MQGVWRGPSRPPASPHEEGQPRPPVCLHCEAPVGRFWRSSTCLTPRWPSRCQRRSVDAVEGISRWRTHRTPPTPTGGCVRRVGRRCSATNPALMPDGRDTGAAGHSVCRSVSRRARGWTMTYHVPVGWWQDSKGTMQPPGSYMDSSLRVGSARHADSSGPVSSLLRWARRRHREPSAVARTP